MNRVTPRLRIYAERLVAYETTRSGSSQSTPAAAFAVIEKLRPHFGPLMGAAGFRALLARAIVLANVEVAWLRDLRVAEDGSFEGLNKLEARSTPEEIATAGIVLLARLLGVLVTLIGENLTLQLLRNFNNVELDPEN